jgi:hypothetical protein
MESCGDSSLLRVARKSLNAARQRAQRKNVKRKEAKKKSSPLKE